MKTAWIAALFSLAAHAQLECVYEKGVFLVKDETGREYRQKVANAKTFVSQCGTDRAALYDGLDLTVFNLDTKRFEWKGVHKDQDRLDLLVSGKLVAFHDGQNFVTYSNGFSSAPAQSYLYSKLEISAEAAALYDGFDFHVYRMKPDFFRKWKVRSKTPYARVAVFGEIAVLYDGGEFFVYDGQSDRLFNRTVKSSVTTTLLAGRTSAIYYEGTTLTAYCSTIPDFLVHVTGKKEWNNAFYNVEKDRYEIDLDRKKYFVDGETCELDPA